MSRLSIVIPCLNEAENIVHLLDALQPLRARGAEVIVVDGGSDDESAALARLHADRVLEAPRGRAVQMNAGAALAQGDTLLFLHADSRLPADADRLIDKGLASTGRMWGRFDVEIDSPRPLLRLTAFLMNTRSRATGIATGDQALFATRAAFAAAGGYPAMRLMEDIALSRALKRCGRPLCLRARVVTSARRWEKHGVVRTILLMWRLRLAYYFGADPDVLALRYAAHK
jgi:rSAM/selenodomain-associated transferase 2